MSQYPRMDHPLEVLYASMYDELPGQIRNENGASRAATPAGDAASQLDDGGEEAGGRWSQLARSCLSRIRVQW